MAKPIRDTVRTYAAVGAVFCIPIAIVFLLSWLGYSRTRTEPNFLQPYAGTGLLVTAVVFAVLTAVSKLLTRPQTAQEKYRARLDSLGLSFPDELTTRTAPVVVRKLYESTDEAPHSWIGGPPPTKLEHWPLNPMNGQPLHHMLTISFAQLAPFVPRFMLPTYGQLSFFACALDQIPPSSARFNTDGFAVVMTPEDSAPDFEADAAFTMTPVDFIFPTAPPPTEPPMEGRLSDSHQMFGEGLHVQDQLFAVQDREMLLQIGNDNDVGVRNLGVMQFMMYPEEIKAQAWDKAVVVLAFD